ncbi:MAG: hypothetical protein IJP14_02985 [Clostridia bacterium]|nr:hypothetical protein [Clostridia bacterium]
MQEKIIATEGHILTNGEIYGTEIYVGQGIDPADFHEITVEDYQRIFDVREVDENGK